MIPRLKPVLDRRELVALWRPAGSGQVARFEESFARLMCQKHAIAFPYGRTALMFLLQALGLKDVEIICPAYTCVVVAHAVVKSGNRPVFVDCREDDFNMDLDEAETKITEHTGAIIATSIFGYPVDLDKLAGIRQRHPHVKIIQDCAHGFDARFGDRRVQQAGEAAFFGLNISKLMTSIFGGMITTDNEDLAARLRGLQERSLEKPGWKKAWRRRLYLTLVYPAFSSLIFGLTYRLEHSGLLNRFVKYYDEEKIDMPADYLDAMGGVEAGIGLCQVEKYAAIIQHRRRLASFYDQSLREIEGLKRPPLVEGATYSHYAPLVSHREEVLAAAAHKGLQLGKIIEYCIPEMAAYRHFPGSAGAFPAASRFARTTINLPLWVSQDKAHKVAGIVRDILPIILRQGVP